MSAENRFRYEAGIHLASSLLPLTLDDRRWLRHAPGHGRGWLETVGNVHPQLMEDWRAWLWDEAAGSVEPKKKADYGDASLLDLAARRIATRLKQFVPPQGA